jgi:hypothetical protein
MDDAPIRNRRRTRRRWLVTAACAGAAAGLGLSGYVWLTPNPSHHEVAAPAPTVLAVHQPTTPSTSAPAPPKPVVPHDSVAPAVPTAFTLAGRGFRIAARVCAMRPVFPLTPPGDEHHTVCWVKKGFGYAPGSSSGTSYVLGHSWAPDPREVLNKASERATRDVLRAKSQRLDGVQVYPAPSMLGARITLRTPTGTLVYAVRQAFGVDKMKLGNIAQVMNQRIHNRVLLITCAELNGVDYHYNIVLDARLISSRSTRS